MLVIVFVLILIGNFCGANEALAQAEPPEPNGVSLVQLIANPREYHEKLVRVIGFCRLEFEGDALYLHREDFEQGITKNAVWLDIEPPASVSPQNLSDGYVLVEAVFDAESKGHMDLFSGTLKVKKMGHWRSRHETERMQPPPPQQQ
jgi:hypothetical protein